ncbi:MAG: hypothetical protein ABL957_10130 [Parvularculaceae bacterium]
MSLIFQAAAALALWAATQHGAAASLAGKAIGIISIGSDEGAARPRASLAESSTNPAAHDTEALSAPIAAAVLVISALAGLAFAGRGRTEST